MRWIVFLATCLFATIATADTFKREVEVNKGGGIDGIGYFNRATCGSTAMPKVKIKKQPAHGKLYLKETTSPINRKMTVCKGKKINVVHVFYKPNKGYKGKDEASISYQIFGTGSRPIYRGNTYKITVK